MDSLCYSYDFLMDECEIMMLLQNFGESVWNHDAPPIFWWINVKTLLLFRVFSRSVQSHDSSIIFLLICLVCSSGSVCSCYDFGCLWQWCFRYSLNI